MTILGINTESDGFGAAVVVDGRVASAVEQFKIRERRPSMDNTPTPREAVAMSLEAARVDPSEIDVIAFIGDLDSAERMAPHIRRLDVNPRARLEPIEHAAAHSAAAFYSSPFDHAGVLILDRGPSPGGPSLGVGDGERVEIEEIPFRLSALSRVYGRISSALGFLPWNANKAAWLGASGEPEYLDSFHSLFSKDSSDAGVDGLLKTIGLERPQNVAASLQAWTIEIVIRLAEDFCQRRRVDRLSVAGHLAENPLLIRKLEQYFGENNVFVPPAPGRESLSIGAAWTYMRSVAKAHAELRFPYPALGPEFTDAYLKAELDNCKLPSSFFPGIDALIEIACRKLIGGGLVGWFQGRCEFGHRALGFRSILANPSTPYIDENINRFLKHREPFHPFVISVTEESAADYFESVGANARTIASIYPLRGDRRNLLSKFTLRSGDIRVHTVNSADNHLFWTLLRQMQALTGHPLLINTSFNLPTEPLALTPRDAIRSFYASGLDLLAIGRFLVTK